LEHWWIYLLTFVFGYVTCKTFYFIRALRTGLTLLQGAHVIYLSSLVKAMEHFSYAREMVLEHMLKTERGSTQISSFEMRFEDDIRLFKKRSIEVLLYCHPPFFRRMVEFKDWQSAMDFLQENRESALRFWDSTE